MFIRILHILVIFPDLEVQKGAQVQSLPGGRPKRGTLASFPEPWYTCGRARGSDSREPESHR